jgi:hypothetical protein
MPSWVPSPAKKYWIGPGAQLFSVGYDEHHLEVLPEKVLVQVRVLGLDHDDPYDLVEDDRLTIDLLAAKMGYYRAMLYNTCLYVISNPKYPISRRLVKQLEDWMIENGYDRGVRVE